MADHRVFGKTPKGVAEVSARSGALSMAARRVLILIDGARAVARPATMARAEGLADSLRTLASGGCSALMGHSAPTPAEVTSETRPAPVSGRRR